MDCMYERTDGQTNTKRRTLSLTFALNQSGFSRVFTAANLLILPHAARHRFFYHGKTFPFHPITSAWSKAHWWSFTVIDAFQTTNVSETVLALKTEIMEICFAGKKQPTALLHQLKYVVVLVWENADILQTNSWFLLDLSASYTRSLLPVSGAFLKPDLFRASTAFVNLAK